MVKKFITIIINIKGAHTLKEKKKVYKKRNVNFIELNLDLNMFDSCALFHFRIFFFFKFKEDIQLMSIVCVVIILLFFL